MLGGASIGGESLSVFCSQISKKKLLVVWGEGVVSPRSTLGLFTPSSVQLTYKALYARTPDYFGCFLLSL